MHARLLSIFIALLIVTLLTPIVVQAQGYRFIQFLYKDGTLDFTANHQENLSIKWITETNEEISQEFTIAQGQHTILTPPAGTICFYFLGNGGIGIANLIIDTNLVRVSNNGLYVIPTRNMDIISSNDTITFATSDGSNPPDIFLLWANSSGPMKLSFVNGQATISRPQRDPASILFRHQDFTVSGNITWTMDGWYRLPPVKLVATSQTYIPALTR